MLKYFFRLDIYFYQEDAEEDSESGEENFMFNI